MVCFATTRPAAEPGALGLPACEPETYYPTVGTRLYVAATTVGLSLFYEAGCQVQPEHLRFAFADSVTPGRRVLTIEIEYSPEPPCPSEL
ncbi:hypothetical protein [Hymenobacter sp. CRA2]|uniref:hypothetical protein n=1 Tax=Hymenobacter sp. CRA2 TaxID=1955620 RepID=UPI00098ED863|nr:hypothetical protein [Hymenobacter sp. CRA2]OON70552.1 hypothetical protein B0919_00560 [Hymenobacter sp. CRA2]